MKAKTLQVVWHSKEPVFSVDFHPDGFFATGGADMEIKFWELACDADGNPSARYVSSLSSHARSVNCVRFSPRGDVLASAGDGGEIFLWRPSASGARSALEEPEGEEAAAAWKAVACLRGLREDVQDMAWSPDGTALLAGGVENETVVFDVETRKALARFQDHKHYVQGVCWDPLGQFLITQSVDRTCKVYGHKPPPNGKKPAGILSSADQAKDLMQQGTISKRMLSAPAPAAAAEGDTCSPGEGSGKAGKTVPTHLLHDEGLATFFRRLAWSPDGSFVVVPAGLYRESTDAVPIDACYVFARGEWSRPAMQLPSMSKGTPVVVRCCPQLFRRTHLAGSGAEQGGDDSNPFGLPYHVVFAVGTLDSVLLYTTQSLAPALLLGNMHYAPITDMAWAPDGRALVVASHDGYCSVVTFKPGELGEPLPPEDLPPEYAARRTRLHAPLQGGSSTASNAAAAASPAAAAAAAAAVPRKALTPVQATCTLRQPLGVVSAQQQRLPQRITPQPVPAQHIMLQPVPAATAAATAAVQQAPSDAARTSQGVKRIRAEPVAPPPPAAAAVAGPPAITRPVATSGPSEARPARAAAIAAAQSMAGMSTRGPSLAMQALRLGLAAAKKVAPIPDAAGSNVQDGSCDSSDNKRARVQCDSTVGGSFASAHNG